MRLSQRIQRVEPSATLAITAKAKELKAQGVDIIGFGAGEPDFDTPQAVCEAAKQAIDDGKTRYLPVAGLPALRQAVADDYRRRDRQVASDEVVITVGGKQALYNATQVLFDPGDLALVPAPCWVSYPAQLRLAGARAELIDTTVEQGYKMAPEDLDQALSTTKARGLILCSPANPTGATYNAEELAGLGEVLRDYPEVIVFFDAMYDRVYYDDEIAPDLVAAAPHLEDRVVTFNGFSKTYAMTGWRLGYGIGPKAVIKAMAKLQGQSTSNATSFVQYAALEALALPDDLLAKRREAFRKRRDLIVEKLDAIDGVTCPSPAGAFYVFPDFSSYLSAQGGRFENDLALTEFLLEEAGVAVVPGSAFGYDGGLRLSYALADDEISEGIDRIAQALSK